MKKLVIMLLASGIVACNENEVPYTISPEDLPGTYWKETERYYSYLKDGKYVSEGNMLDGWDGAGGQEILYFSGVRQIVEYVRLGVTDRPIKQYYRTGTYKYDMSQNRMTTDFDLFESATTVNVEMFTSSKIVVSYPGDKDGHSIMRHIFEPFYPSDEWKALVAGYPNYDEIDWSQHQ